MTEFKIDALRQSLKTLKEAWAAYQSNQENGLTSIIADSCVQRYEYTLETAWKLMKKYLKQTYGKSDEELTINNIFRLMSGYNMIGDWENWKEYYLKRNETAHEYSIEKSRGVLLLIPRFIDDAERLVSSFDRVSENA